MPKNYDPKTVEHPIFESWQEGGYFAQEPVEGPAYTVVIPPPNVTGSLHMGHALNNTIQDVLIRRSRMSGVPTRWIVGTDHAGIATQNKVEQKLAKQGLSRFDVGREAFVEECWKWRDEHGSTIIGQLKAMGCSCDYDDEQFTMDPGYQKAVRNVFVDWYDKGLIYRGKRIINWCPRCTTALSDIEVEHEDVAGNLWYMRYPLKEPVGDISYVVVATTRPETIPGDVAVAVSPDDDRYRDLIGATVILPILGREIPIVADEYVDPDFGTGMVKITPAHDPNDFEVGERHNLPKINVIDGDGRLNSLAGERFEGLDRFEAREEIVKAFVELGFVERVEEHTRPVGHCYRCNTIIEPWLSDQWFVDMKPLAAPAIEAVRDGRVEFAPKRWENVYFHWMENIRDWCISRQLWWGHRIPVFYCDTCGWQGASIDDIDECPVCGAEVRQDEDVLDTWFSSQLWPFATMGWPEKTAELASFYPTAVLSTARDILFLWVARMVMAGMYFMDGEVPFADVIIHPTVFNAEGRRMSKSLGTGVDPLDLMENYGADGMRFGLMLQVTGAQDLKFSEEKLASSRNFTNKIWNASRFVLMNLEGFTPGEPVAETVADRWILSRLAGLARRVDAGLTEYEFGEVARDLYEFFWNEYCDWYIELAKGRLAAGGESRQNVQRNLVFVLDTALRLLHPMMPFVTEEIWRHVPHGDTAASLMVAAWPQADDLARFVDDEAERSILAVQSAIIAVRGVRSRYGISPKLKLDAVVKAPEAEAVLLEANAALISDLARLGSFTVAVDATKPEQSSVAVVGALEVYVPLAGLVDFDAERARLSKERASAAADLAKLEKKLGNEGFLAKASPEIVEKDRAKAAELADKVALIDGQLAEIG